jgi:nucleoside-diphosphate-sugar epimerase
LSHVLVTGGSGFIGGAVLSALTRAGHEVRWTARRSSDPRAFVVGPIGPETDWTVALQGIEAVVHLAGRAHTPRDLASDPQEAFDRVNLQGSRRLAEQAAAAGVRRFVFVSSIKVNGEVTHGRAFTESDPPAPRDAYARSKAGAERALEKIAARSPMAIVILRPPLVYGPGVKANFLSLLKLVATGLPLPFGSIANRRSFMFVDNLADCIVRVLEASPRPGCRTYLVSDGEDLSTAELIARLRAGMGLQPRLIRFPPAVLRGLAWLAGHQDEAGRLIDSLRIDSTAFQRDYAWQPPVPPQEALARAARWFATRKTDRSRKVSIKA